MRICRFSLSARIKFYCISNWCGSYIFLNYYIQKINWYFQIKEMLKFLSYIETKYNFEINIIYTLKITLIFKKISCTIVNTKKFI